MAAKNPRSVLFVCNMNQIRSPMAEFLTRDLFGHNIFAQSAGLQKGGDDGFMHSVMKERNIDVSAHEPEALDDLEDHFVDLVITLTPGAQEACEAFFKDEAVDMEYWPTDNPADVSGRREEMLEAYRRTRNALEARIQERFG